MPHTPPTFFTQFSPPFTSAVLYTVDWTFLEPTGALPYHSILHVFLPIATVSDNYIPHYVGKERWKEKLGGGLLEG